MPTNWDTEQSCRRSLAFAQVSIFLTTHHIQSEAEQSQRPPPVPSTSPVKRTRTWPPNPTTPSHCQTYPTLLHPPTLIPPCLRPGNGKVTRPQNNPSLPPIFPHALLRKHLSVQEIRVWWGGEEQWKNDGGEGRGAKWVRETARMGSGGLVEKRSWREIDWVGMGGIDRR